MDRREWIKLGAGAVVGGLAPAVAMGAGVASGGRGC